LTHFGRRIEPSNGSPSDAAAGEFTSLVNPRKQALIREEIQNVLDETEGIVKKLKMTSDIHIGKLPY
jgi:hypothetical protein